MRSLRFIKSLSTLILLNLIVKPIWIFFIDRQVQVIIGNEAYGRYFALFNFTYILSFLSDAGLSNFMNQRLASGLETSLRPFVKLKLGLLLFYCIICFIAGWIFDITEWQIFIYLVIINILGSLFIFLRAIISALQFFKADSFLSIIDKFLMIILCSGFIYGAFRNIDLALFLKFQVLSTASSIFIAAFFVLKKRFLNLAESNNDYKLAIPFALVILLMSLHNRLDGFLISRLNVNGNLESGIYAAGYRLLDAANMIGYLMAAFLVPFIANNSMTPDIRELLVKCRNVILMLGMFAISFVFINSQHLQKLLYNSDTNYISEVIKTVMLSLPAYYLVHIYGSVFTAFADFRTFISVLVVAVVINCTGNILFIPLYGGLAAAVVSIVSQYLCGFTLFILASKKYCIDKDFTGLMSILGLLIVFLIGFYILKALGLNIIIQVMIVFIPLFIYILKQFNYFRRNFIHA